MGGVDSTFHIGTEVETLGIERKVTQMEREAASPVDADFIMPGFRFHPTEEELVGYYLRRMVEGKPLAIELISTVDLYRFDPWELPAMAHIGEQQRFFFVPRDSKYPNGGRPNRITKSGFWKATGIDKPVYGPYKCSQFAALRKTLVFYMGRAPKGSKTDWIMNEYRMSTTECSYYPSMRSIDPKNYEVTLCRIYKKSVSCNQRRGLMEDSLPDLTSCADRHCGSATSMSCTSPYPPSEVKTEDNSRTLKSTMQIILDSQVKFSSPRGFALQGQVHAEVSSRCSPSSRADLEKEILLSSSKDPSDTLPLQNYPYSTGDPDTQTSLRAAMSTESDQITRRNSSKNSLRPSKLELEYTRTFLDYSNQFPEFASVLPTPSPLAKLRAEVSAFCPYIPASLWSPNLLSQQEVRDEPMNDMDFNC